MAYDAHANFAYTTVLTPPSPATTGTTLVLAAGQGALFPAAPFNCTVWPIATNPLSTNAEIIRVTAISSDTLTIVRAQEGSSARTIVVGDQIANTVTKKTLTDVEANAPVFTAKGDLQAGTGAGTAVIVAVGSDGTTLTADAASAGGVKWTTPAGGGDVTGPGSSTDGNVAVFNGATGKVIKDGGTPAVLTAATIHAATGKTTPADADETGGGAPRKRRRYEAEAECNVLHRFRITADGRALVLAGADVSRAIVLAVNVSTANVWAGGEAPIEHETTTTAGKASGISAGEAAMEHRSGSRGGAYALAPESLAAEQESDDELALMGSLKL